MALLASAAICAARAAKIEYGLWLTAVETFFSSRML